jgi:hypothetical protein
VVAAIDQQESSMLRELARIQEKSPKGGGYQGGGRGESEISEPPESEREEESERLRGESGEGSGGSNGRS